MRCLDLFEPFDPSNRRDVIPGLEAQFARSGHMVGSCFVRLDDGRHSILFSGDVGRPNDLVLKPPAPVAGADCLVVESTYGDRDHPDGDPLPRIADVVNRTAARDGVVVIPAFAVGRAQTLLHCLARLKRERRIPDVPVYLNSPMAASAMAVYQKHRDEIRLGPDECRALGAAARIVETPEESERLNSRDGPMVIIAGSGMATGGRVVHHLKAFAPDRRNTIMLVGYQAGGTRGAAIASGAPSVRIHGQDVRIRAEVVKLDDMSAHADRNEMLQWLRTLAPAPRYACITHGEPAAADALRQKIERELGWKCRVPYYLESLDLG